MIQYSFYSPFHDSQYSLMVDFPNKKSPLQYYPFLRFADCEMSRGHILWFFIFGENIENTEEFDIDIVDNL